MGQIKSRQVSKHANRTDEAEEAKVVGRIDVNGRRDGTRARARRTRLDVRYARRRDTKAGERCDVQQIERQTCRRWSSGGRAAGVVSGPLGTVDKLHPGFSDPGLFL